MTFHVFCIPLKFQYLFRIIELFKFLFNRFKNTFIIFIDFFIFGGTFLEIFFIKSLFLFGRFCNLFRMQLKISRNFLYASLGSFIFLILSHVVSCSFCLNKFVEFSSYISYRQNVHYVFKPYSRLFGGQI